MIINNKEYKPLEEYIKNIDMENYILHEIIKIIMNNDNMSRKKKTDFLLHDISGIVYATDKIVEEIKKLYPKIKKQYEN